MGQGLDSYTTRIGISSGLELTIDEIVLFYLGNMKGFVLNLFLNECSERDLSTSWKSFET